MSWRSGCEALGLPDEWTPRELRHSFVSLLPDSGVPLEEISRLVGHSGTSVTVLMYLHQARPALQTGAVAMDGLFGTVKADPWSPWLFTLQRTEALSLYEQKGLWPAVLCGRGDRI